jgi:site-specific DNA-methyltransferase (adenine-specific)
MAWEVMHGDSRELLPGIPDRSVDAVVTDPPAGIAFMGKEWDDFRRARNTADAGRGDVFGRTSAHAPEIGRRSRDAFVGWLSSILAECLRVLKPGGHALVWAIPRTSHWTGTALEDAGFEVRDVVAHLFGTGFPKSLNLPGGFGTALKPAAEFWWLARKPLVGTVASNVLEHGTGALNIDGCRIGSRTEIHASAPRALRAGFIKGFVSGTRTERKDHGRWPAHLVLTHSAGCGMVAAAQGSLIGEEQEWRCELDCPVRMLDEQSGPLQSGGTPSRRKAAKFKNSYGEFKGTERAEGIGSSRGGASRFFYQAKPGRKERGDGNDHPTVKSIELMRWLCRLITPPGGTILDPFCGSGSTGCAALAEGFGFIGIEQDEHYVEIARGRIRDHERRTR